MKNRQKSAHRPLFIRITSLEYQRFNRAKEKLLNFFFQEDEFIIYDDVRAAAQNAS